MVIMVSNIGMVCIGVQCNNGYGEQWLWKTWLGANELLARCQGGISRLLRCHELVVMSDVVLCS